MKEQCIAVREYHLSLKDQIKAVLDRLHYTGDDFRRYRTLWKGVYGWLLQNEACVLFEMAKSTHLMGDIVEIGSAYGRSTVCLGWGARLTERDKVYSIDPHTGGIGFREQLGEAKDTYSSVDGFLKNIKRFGLEEWVIPIVMTSEEAFKQWKGTGVRLLFIDGWHTYDAVRYDILSWRKYLISGGIIAMHDYQCEDVRRAIHDSIAILGYEEPDLKHIDANMVFFQI